MTVFVRSSQPNRGARQLLRGEFCLLGGYSEVPHIEAFPRRAFEVRDVEVAAGIDVHRFFLRTEGVEQRDPALTWRDRVLPLKNVLDRNRYGLCGLLERVGALSQTGEP